MQVFNLELRWHTWPTCKFYVETCRLIYIGRKLEWSSLFLRIQRATPKKCHRWARQLIRPKKKKEKKETKHLDACMQVVKVSSNRGLRLRERPETRERPILTKAMIIVWEMTLQYLLFSFHAIYICLLNIHTWCWCSLKWPQ